MSLTIEINKHLNVSAMRILYALLILNVLITVSACQRGAHRMYMDDSDHYVAGQSQKEPDVSSTSLAVITDGLSCMHPKEASVQTSSATSSPNSSAGGSSMSVQMPSVQGSEMPLSTKPMEVALPETTDTQAAPDYSSEDHENWFHEFVCVVDNTEEWSEITKVLDKGKSLGYLTKPIGWDDDEYTPLHYAAEEGDLEVVQELIEARNIPVDIRTGVHQRTPLHLAALGGNLETAKYLMSKEANPNVCDTEQSNVLHYAASGIKGENNTQVVIFLIKDKDADYESLADDKFSLLYLAIKASNTDLVHYIVEQLPELVTRKTCSVSPLEFAKYKGDQGIIDLIQKEL